ncbi:MAG: hypothetical protein WAN46_15710 [Gammaproteobacteria bacterium]
MKHLEESNTAMQHETFIPTLTSCVLKAISLAGALALAGCAVQAIQPSPPLDASAPWGLLPIMNHADTPEAGERVAAIAGTLLRAQGVTHLVSYQHPEDSAPLPELNQQRRLAQARAWATEQRLSYALTGSVEEWRYKSGLDGEPSVGVTLQVIAPKSGEVLWSASGSRSGWGRESLSGTGHKLLKSLIKKLNLKTNGEHG